MIRTLCGYILSLDNIVPFDSKRVAMCLRRKRAEITNFSTWVGCKSTVKSVPLRWTSLISRQPLRRPLPVISMLEEVNAGASERFREKTS
jgi:hypothetical protein